MAQQEQRMTGIARAVMQPPRRRQVETRGAAARFHEHSREAAQPGGLLGDPQHIRELVGLRDQQSGGVHAKKEA
jgi:hypothetical protein